MRPSYPVPTGRAALALAAVIFLQHLPAPARADDRVAPVPPPSPRNLTFAAGAEEVRVDLVVRDRKGALLRDLTAADLEVLEDGVRQDVLSLEVVSGAALPPEEGAETGPSPSILVFVFDRLSPGARSFARESLASFLDALPGKPPRMAAFSIENGLRPLSPLTDDTSAIRRVADELLTSTPRSLASARDRQDILNAFAGMVEGIGQAYVAPAELAGVPECRGREADQVRQSEFLAARMAGMYQNLERDQQGQGTLNALLALVGTLESLPGRKAAVLFSEGLILPGGENGVRSLVAAANRAGVSVYGADASGLRAASETDETRRTLDSIRARLRQNVLVAPVSVPGSSAPVAEGGLTLLERGEEALRLTAAVNLGTLAAQTGGAFFERTNDLGPGLLTAAEDLHEHYLLRYAPRNRNYDGRFRSIEVKVKRPHGRVQARRGYLAVRTASAVPVLAHEALALAQLESGAGPGDLPVRVRGLQFPGEAALARVPVFVELDAASLRAAGGRRDFTVLALARDSGGRVAAKMSQRYSMEGRVGGGNGAPGTRLQFSREASLPPGAYSLEAVVYDHVSGRAGVARAALDVPASTHDQLRASSLMVVDRAEPRDPSAAAGDEGRPSGVPLLAYGDVVLYPNLGQPLHRATGKALAFSVTALPNAERPTVEAQVEVLREGQRILAPPRTPMLADGDGRLRLVSSLPLDALLPGNYELRVTLSDGRDAETRTATVPILP